MERFVGSWGGGLGRGRVDWKGGWIGKRGWIGGVDWGGGLASGWDG